MEETLENVSIDELASEMPDTSPRYVICRHFISGVEGEGGCSGVSGWNEFCSFVVVICYLNHFVCLVCTNFSLSWLI